MAKMMFVLAAGQHIDPDRNEDFTGQVDAAFRNPFEAKAKKREPHTAAEIKQYILCKLEGKEWT